MPRDRSFAQILPTVTSSRGHIIPPARLNRPLQSQAASVNLYTANKLVFQRTGMHLVNVSGMKAIRHLREEYRPLAAVGG
jgi:hypothetical protein